MSELKLTKEQEAVIESRRRSLLVSAGAGSGKTWVLVQRLMGFLNPEDSSKRTDLDRFLIITFTKAAATELRAKISEEISKAIAEESLKNPASDTLKHLRRQNALVSRAHIGTIHSFCADILREYGGRVGIRPGFKIAEDELCSRMKEEALDRVLEERYAAPDRLPGFRQLADTVGFGKDDKQLVEAVKTVYEKIQSQANPELWIEKTKQDLTANWEDLSQSPWGREVMADDLRKAEDKLYAAKRLVTLAAESPEQQKRVPMLQEVEDFYRRLVQALDVNRGGSWNSAREVCGQYKFSRLATVKNPADTVLNEKISNGKKKLSEDAKDFAAHYSRPEEKMLAEMAEVAEPMQALLELVRDYGKEYERAKRENSLADYSDLEHCAAKILLDEQGGPTAAALAVSRRFQEIMVDEYQDVNDVQDSIFRAVSDSGRNLFFVGDIKQSIYRFRLADPSIFNEKLHNWKLWTDSGAEEAAVIPLQQNFRSASSVIRGINSIFKACMSEELGDVDYLDPNQQLVTGADYEEAGPKPELIIIQPAASDDDGEDTPGKTRTEAAVVAGKIRSLVEEEKPLVGKRGSRAPVRYSDVAILLRAAKGKENIYREELERVGVPVNSGAEENFWQTPEIAQLTSLLSVIDNPRKDVELIAVLRSPFFGFSADDLATVRAADKAVCLYSALRTAAEKNPSCADFLARLDGLREDAVGMTVGELVWHVMCRTDMMSVCSARQDGELARARLIRFVELAQKFENDGNRGLHRFVRWIARQRQGDSKQAANASSVSGVNILTIHKSKGLEYPVVFVCDLGKQFNSGDESKPVLVHTELGLGPCIYEPENMIKYDSPARLAIKQRIRTESRSEEMRLLYVALTRAKERLYMTGTANDLEKFQGSINKLTEDGKLRPQQLHEQNSMLNWLAAAVCVSKDDAVLLSKITWEGWQGYTKRREEKKTAEEQADRQEILIALAENLSAEYPYPQAVELPSKVTATELKGSAEEDPEALALTEPAESSRPASAEYFRLPDFTLKNRPLGGAARGIATHLVLQHIDYARTGSEQEIRAEIRRLTERAFISEKQADAVNVEAILKLFASDIGKKLLHSGKVRREFRFSVLTPAQELLGTGGDEQLLLQGVVDCFVEEEDGLVLVDYKTDSVRTEKEIRTRAAHYAGQLRAYSSALARICGKPVKECVLYFLTAGKEVHLEEK